MSELVPQVAFLRAVNVGGRKVLMADLRQAFADLGFSSAKTLLASGNVLFSAPGDPDLAARIEAGLLKHFGITIELVLRTRAELQALIAAAPFAAVPPDADVKLYCILFRGGEAGTLQLPFGVAGDFDVVSTTTREIFAIAYKTPDGRYGPGLDSIGKQFGRKVLWTSRNWNTINKAAHGGTA